MDAILKKAQEVETHINNLGIRASLLISGSSFMGISVNRDDICGKMECEDENRSYEKFLDLLENEFIGKRFFYVGKTDEVLFLQYFNEP